MPQQYNVFKTEMVQEVQAVSRKSRDSITERRPFRFSLAAVVNGQTAKGVRQDVKLPGEPRRRLRPAWKQHERPSLPRFEVMESHCVVRGEACRACFQRITCPSSANLIRRTGVVELGSRTTLMTERADTMKTYILCHPKAVEPQNPPVRRRRLAAPIPASPPSLSAKSKKPHVNAATPVGTARGHRLKEQLRKGKRA